MLSVCARAQFLSLLVSLVESLTMKPKASKCQMHWYDSLLLFSSLSSFFLALRHEGLTLASIKTAFVPHSSCSAWGEYKTLFEDTYSHIQVAVGDKTDNTKQIFLLNTFSCSESALASGHRAEGMEQIAKDWNDEFFDKRLIPKLHTMLVHH